MSLDSNHRTPRRGRASQDLWPKWMWIAVPVLVVVVVAGLWWAIFSPSEAATSEPTPTATMRIIREQPTQGPTLQSTLPALEPTATRPVLPLPTFTNAPAAVSTPTSSTQIETAASLSVGSQAKVVGTGGSGLNVRSGAGMGNARVKTLPDGTAVEVIGGPKDADGFTWWQIRDQAGVTGWVASKYLEASS
jgi:hypothetical protein